MWDAPPVGTDAAQGEADGGDDSSGRTQDPVRPGHAQRVARRLKYSASASAAGLLAYSGAGTAIWASNSTSENLAPWLAPLGVAVAVVGAVLVLFVFYLIVISRAQQEEEEEFLARSVAVEEAAERIEGPTDLVGLTRANRAQMEAYDSIARSQAEGAHRNAFLAMGAGLLILLSGAAVAVFADADSAKYSAAVISSVGVATSGYIARTFIRVRDSASQQMAFYFQQPLVQSYLLSAERLATQLSDERKPGQIEAILAAALAQASHASAPAPERE